VDIGKLARVGISVFVLLVAGLAPIIAGTTNLLVAEQVVTPGAARIGDRLNYELRVTYDAPVQLVDIGNSGIVSPFAVIQFKKIREKKGGHPVFRYVATISPFSTGRYVIGERTIKYKIGKKVDRFVVPAIQVDVISVLTATNNQMQDIKTAPPLAMPLRRVAIGFGVVVAVIGSAIVWWIIRRKSTDVDVEFVPIADHRSIDQIAQDALSDAQQLMDDPVGFYTSLADILRRFLGQKFELDSQEMTTSELVRALESICDPWIVKQVGRILQLCDLVKFAKFSPRREDAQIALDKSRAIVTRLTETLAEEIVDEAS